MEAAKYLLQIPMWTREKNSLEDIRRFLGRLGDPDRSMNIIHVAGTNGKGSVCAFLTSVLRRAGYRTGTFVSPHLTDIRERFLVDGGMAPEASFQDAFLSVYGLTKDMEREGCRHPAYFEFLFLMAMDLFYKERVDYVILETGLGGRLDATNAVEKPLACVITSISLDHTEYLGGTIREISREKAGIVKAGVPVIYDARSEEAAMVIRERARRLGVPSIPVLEQDFTSRFTGREWEVRVDPFPYGAAGAPLSFRIPSLAPYQRINAVLAVRTLEAVLSGGLERSDIRDGIGGARWPGRMEEVLPGVYLDGAHNPDGVREAARAVRLVKQTGVRPVVLLFSAVKDKDYREMARILSQLDFDGVFVTHIDNSRALDMKELKELFSFFSCPVKAVDRVQEAFEAACRAKGEDGVLFCLGSLYLIGELKAAVKEPDHGRRACGKEEEHDRL